jgi:hypothetical protein
MDRKKIIDFTRSIVALVAIGFGSSAAIAGGFLNIEFTQNYLESNFDDPPSLVINNAYWPLAPDTNPRVFTYIGFADGECVVDQVSVNDTILGATYTLTGAAPYTDLEVVQVVDTEWVFEVEEEEDCDVALLPDDDAIAEKTLDWYLEDNQENIWYMGEYSQSFDEEDGCDEYEFVAGGASIPDVCKEGSWEAGMNGAPAGEDEVIGIAGIVVPGNEPVAGEPLTKGTYYMQEEAYEAEDMAKILRLDASLSVDVENVNIDWDYDNCRKVKEWNPFEHGQSVEHKWYCHHAGIGPGLVLIEGVGGGRTEIEELVEIDPPLINP